MNADYLLVALDDAFRNKILARGVGLDDGMDQVLRDILIVGEHLFRIFWQAIAAVTKRRVVVVISDARIEAYSLDDLFRIKPMGGRISVELVEVGYAHGKVGVGEELDRLGLCRVGKQGGDVLLDRTLLEQIGKGLGACGAFADDDARGVQVVV